MKTYYYNLLNNESLDALLKRPAIDLNGAFEIVRPVLSDIKQNGLIAALKYAAKFDNFSGKELLVQPEEFVTAERNLNPAVKEAIEKASENIEKFHKRQLPEPYEIETMPGVRCSREYRAIENVGLYIPGGNAILPSTMLMLGIPAHIAGCKRIVACSPAKDGKVNDALLFAAKVAGVSEFYKIGGAQAVAMMAYGAGTINKVSKIFGPGNQFVTAAKLLVSIDIEGCAIDMPAGPSEVLVIADENARADYIASDLLSQAEHGADSQVVFITTSEKLIVQVEAELNKQTGVLPRREFAFKSLESSFSLLVENPDQAFSFSNQYAPEHLILHLDEAEKYKEKVINAGSVFLGQYSPESAGDYASGTNHSLPTYGYAKSFGGVSVESFMKSITFQKLTRDGLRAIAGVVETLAKTESLEAHRNAVSIRIKDDN
ncbi:MAG: histidinol dehydrogenase [Ignavibacteria bacterium]